MAKRLKKRDIDEQLLSAIFTLEHDWKQMRAITEKSVDPTWNALYMEHLARAKYLYLLREAKHRKVSAIMYR
ncbi:YaaL family protein [Lentibacillus saliphilus]|uniref:YaaL family protein n=1 Tax=Lentibacillus saliphilus TaxID=2737028 RepID=UPI001C30324E|nr:YaaL family protein [Lentibacillus saliphilus]